MNFSGVITALITPFKNGEVDLNSYRRLLRSQLDQGVDGFVVNGTTGESPTLTREEVRILFEVAKTEVAGQVPLILGTGSNATAKTVEMTRWAETLSPDGVLVVVPYYNKPPQRGLKLHFETVARATKLPVLLYNVPSRTLVSLDAATVQSLSDVDNIVGIKDATGNMETLSQLRSAVPKDFILLSGDDGTCVEFCSSGGNGVIAVASHVIGSEMKQALDLATQGQKQITESYSSKYKELMKHLYCEANPIPVKMALHWMGILDSPELRAPLVELAPEFHKDFRSCLKNLGKI